MRIQQTSNTEVEVRKTAEPKLYNIKDVVGIFDEKEEDVSIFLRRFERAMVHSKIPLEDWVIVLTSVVPIVIKELIHREPIELAENYDYVKELFMRKYQLNPEKLRQKFFNIRRLPNQTWADFVYQLTIYFEGWTEGMKAVDVKSLKNLMILNQLKYRVPTQIKEQLSQDWLNLSTPLELQRQLEKNDDLRTCLNQKTSLDYIKIESNPKNVLKVQPKSNVPDKEFKKREDSKISEFKPEFKKRKEMRCYLCNSLDHLRNRCPKRLSSNEPSNVAGIVEEISSFMKETKEDLKVGGISQSDLEKQVMPFKCQGKVNGRQVQILSLIHI